MSFKDLEKLVTEVHNNLRRESEKQKLLSVISDTVDQLDGILTPKTSSRRVGEVLDAINDCFIINPELAGETSKENVTFTDEDIAGVNNLIARGKLEELNSLVFNVYMLKVDACLSNMKELNNDGIMFALLTKGALHKVWNILLNIKNEITTLEDQQKKICFTDVEIPTRYQRGEEMINKINIINSQLKELFPDKS